jgi:hypothetical protein
MGTINADRPAATTLRARHRWTVADVERMIGVGLLDETERVELIEGELIGMAPIGSRHTNLVDAQPHSEVAPQGSALFAREERTAVPLRRPAQPRHRSRRVQAVRRRPPPQGIRQSRHFCSMCGHHRVSLTHGIGYRWPTASVWATSSKESPTVHHRILEFGAHEELSTLQGQATHGGTPRCFCGVVATPAVRSDGAQRFAVWLRLNQGAMGRFRRLQPLEFQQAPLI